MTQFPIIKIFNIFYLVVIASLGGSPCLAGRIVDTKHNLSASGPGDVRALTEDKICVFCHTPHNATPYTPLWNKKIEPKVYTLYDSSTLSVTPEQPSGPTRLCLSCHDGTIALGEVVKPPKPLLPGEEILMRGSDKLSSGKLSSGRSYLGTDISNDHPVNFSYYAALENNPELADTLPLILHTYGAGNIHCTTCHDPHDNTFGKFLVMSNTYSALCTTCHDNKTGWNGPSRTTHATSTAEWDPPAAEEPSQTVAEHGCGSCHVPHGGLGPTRLLRFLKEEDNCYPCHNGTVVATDIQAQFSKTSHHPVEDTTIAVTIHHHDQADDNADVFLQQSHVECVDCHNPHAANASEAAPSEPPAASGRLAMVSGRNTIGAVVNPLTYEYELCFKCHADSGDTVPVIARWIDQNDTMAEFNTGNPSYHPVLATGQNSDVPSLQPAVEQLNEESIISCVDCHDSDESSAVGGTGPRGPHGSDYKPILRQQYGEDGISYTAESISESTLVYALCYRCHDRDTLFSATAGTFFTSVPDPDVNFHTKHVQAPNKIPCYMCHDSHGVESTAGNGDHTHLINFALTVSAYAANPAPFFIDGGSRTGSCTLVCHGKTHDGVTSGIYP